MTPVHFVFYLQPPDLAEFTPVTASIAAATNTACAVSNPNPEISDAAIQTPISQQVFRPTLRRLHVYLIAQRGAALRP